MIPATEQWQIARTIKRSEFYSILIGLCTIAAFVMMAAATDFSKMMEALASFHLLTIMAVLVLALVNYGLRTLRFRYLLASRGHRIPLSEITVLYIAGFAMSATPGKLGEFIRMWFIKRIHGIPYRRSMPVMVADRAYDVLATTLLCVLTLGAFLKYAVPAILLAIIFAVGCIVLARPFLLIKLVDLGYRITGIKPRFFARLRQIVYETSMLFSPKSLAVGLLLGGLGWFSECIALYLCATAFGHLMTIEQATFVFTFSNLVGALTLLPGGVGGTEVSMVAFLSSMGLSLEESAAATFVIRVGTLWFGICCGYVALASCWYRASRHSSN